MGERGRERERERERDDSKGFNGKSGKLSTHKLLYMVQHHLHYSKQLINAFIIEQIVTFKQILHISRMNRRLIINTKISEITLKETETSCVLCAELPM